MTPAEFQAAAAPFVAVAGPLLALALVVYWTWRENKDPGKGLG